MEIFRARGLVQCNCAQNYSFNPGTQEHCQDSIVQNFHTSYQKVWKRNAYAYSSAPEAAKDTENFPGFCVWIHDFHLGITSLQFLGYWSKHLPYTLANLWSKGSNKKGNPQEFLWHLDTDHVISWFLSQKEWHSHEKNIEVLLYWKMVSSMKAFLFVGDTFSLKIYNVSGESTDFASVLSERRNL